MRCASRNAEEQLHRGKSGLGIYLPEPIRRFAGLPPLPNRKRGSFFVLTIVSFMMRCVICDFGRRFPAGKAFFGGGGGAYCAQQKAVTGHKGRKT
jgi:hypothetical protein